MNGFRQILFIGIGTFIVSTVIGITSRLFLSKLGFVLSLSVLLLIIGAGIIFDIVGTAVTAAQEKPFHAMAAKRIAGAQHSLKMIRNADRVANFCNDMVGDVCGTLSGAVGAGIVFSLIAKDPGINESLMTTLSVALVAALTVAGKAAGKGFAINKADDVIFKAGRILSFIERYLHITLFNNKPARKRR